MIIGEILFIGAQGFLVGGILGAHLMHQAHKRKALKGK